jgi:DNA-binding transcriptional regulator YiaG
MGDAMARGKMEAKNVAALFKSVEEMGAILRGRLKPGRVTYRPKPATAGEIKELRHRLSLTQAGLARIVGTVPAAVQSWEQGNRNISGSATKIIRLLEKRPELKDELMAV